jgi:hypothetical protein
MTVEPSNSRKVVAETGGAALGALMGLLFAGPAGAGVGGLIGVTFTPIMERWVGRIVNEWFPARGEVLADAAASSSGLGPDEVVERLLDSEDLQPLVARVLDAASRTNSVETLRLLGAVLGVSVSNRPRRIDEDLMLVDGIRDLEPGHLWLLQCVEQPPDPAEPDSTTVPERIATVVGDKLSPVGLQAAIGGLLARGLIQPVSGYGLGYVITEFGRALLEALRRSSPSDRES